MLALANRALIERMSIDKFVDPTTRLPRMSC